MVFLALSLTGVFYYTRDKHSQRNKVQREFALYFLALFCLIIIHNGLKISVQPYLILLAVATHSIQTVKRKKNLYQTSQSLAQDLPELAACQVTCFPGSFATKLGNAYVAQSLGWFIGTDNRFLFHIKRGAESLAIAAVLYRSLPGMGQPAA